MIVVDHRVSNLFVDVSNQLIAHFARKQLTANFQQSIIVKNWQYCDVILYESATTVQCFKIYKNLLFYGHGA